MSIQIKRVYDLTDTDKGYRILVDRLWPRGIKKSNLKIDEWCKVISPTDKLRKWFGHDPKKWDEFRKKYKLELLSHANELQRITRIGESRSVLLLYSAKDIFHNQAVILKEVIQAELPLRHHLNE